MKVFRSLALLSILSGVSVTQTASAMGQFITTVEEVYPNSNSL